MEDEKVIQNDLPSCFSWLENYESDYNTDDIQLQGSLDRKEHPAEHGYLLGPGSRIWHIVGALNISSIMGSLASAGNDDWNQVDYNGQTPFSLAISGGHEEVAMWFCTRPSFYIKKGDRLRMLLDAVSWKMHRAPTYILESNAGPEHTALQNVGSLYVAVDVGDPELVRILLDHGAEPNRCRIWEWSSRYRWTIPIHINDPVTVLKFSIRKGSLEVLKELLRRGVDQGSRRKVDPNSGNPLQETINLCSAGNHSSGCKILDLLIDAGTSVQSSEWDSSPLQEAVVKRQYQVT